MLPTSLRSFLGLFAGSKNDRRQRRGTSRRTLKLEQLENRQLLATDLATITGVVFTDINDNGTFESGTDTPISGASIELFRDVNNNNVFDAGTDTQIGAAVTTNAQGVYLFDQNLTADRYFVRQAAVTGQVQRVAQTLQTVVINATQVEGAATVIDNFDSSTVDPQISTSTTTPAVTQNAVSDPTILGGFRDIVAVQTSGSGSVAIGVNTAAEPLQLSYDSPVGAEGLWRVVYDGATAVTGAGVDTTGLGATGMDLTEGGLKDGIRFFRTKNSDPYSITIRIYNATTASTATFTQVFPLSAAIPTLTELLIPFSSFSNQIDITQAGALEIEIDGDPGATGTFGLLDFYGRTLVPVNFANLNPMSIGDTVFSDLNNNGVFDNTAAIPEVGLPNVIVQLFLDANANGVIDGSDTAILDGASNPLTDTTDASGNYFFGNLLPSTTGQAYLVVINATQTALANRVSSTGNTAANDRDNGIISGGNVISGPIILVANNAPIDDNDIDNNTDLSIDFGFTPSLDVQIEKLGTTTVDAGGNITYTLTVTNNTPGIDATNVVVTDNLPDGVTFIPNGPNGSTSSAIFVQQNDPDAELIASLGTVQNGTPVVLTVVVSTSGTAAAGTITNISTVTSDGIDLVANNTSDFDTDITSPRFNLSIRKDNGLTSVTTGQIVTYTLTVTNDGPATATNVVVTDVLPAGLEFLSATSNGDPIGTPAGQNFTALLGSMADNEVRLIELVARVRSNATGPNINNPANVIANDSATLEDDLDDNNADDIDPLNRVVTLNITKTDSVDPVLAGGSFSYIVTAWNSGSADAPNVLFSDPLPSGIRFDGGFFTINETVPRNGQVTFNATTQRLEANLGTLLANGTSTTNRALITLNVTALGTTIGALTNTATITNSDFPAGVMADQTTTINPDFDLTITKDDGLTTVLVGQPLVYEIIVSNSGPSTANNITVTDTLPGQLTLGAFTINNGIITNNNGVLTASIPSLAAGQSATITVNTTVSNDAPNNTQLINMARVSVPAGSGERNPDNNTAIATTTINRLGSLSGFVYVDVNRNGVRDAATDTPLANVTVRLTGALVGGSPITPITTTTNENGQYTFNGLAPGSYSVEQIQPLGFNSGATNPGTTGGVPTINLLSNVQINGDNSTVNNFGEITPLSKRQFLASSNPR